MIWHRTLFFRQTANCNNLVETYIILCWFSLWSETLRSERIRELNILVTMLLMILPLSLVDLAGEHAQKDMNGILVFYTVRIVFRRNFFMMNYRHVLSWRYCEAYPWIGATLQVSCRPHQVDIDRIDAGRRSTEIFPSQRSPKMIYL